MNLDIDTNVTFTLGDRKATVDALDFDDFIRELSAKGEEKPGVNADGTPEMRNGKPVTYIFAVWAVVEKEVTDWFKEKCQVDLKRSEARAIWTQGKDVWAKKNESWQEPAPAAAPPTSPSSTDLRHSD